MPTLFAFQTSRSLLVLTALVVSSGAWAQAQPQGQAQCQVFQTDSIGHIRKANEAHQKADEELQKKYGKSVTPSVYQSAHQTVDGENQKASSQALQDSGSSYCIQPAQEYIKVAREANTAAQRQANAGTDDFSAATEKNINGAGLGTQVSKFSGEVDQAKTKTEKAKVYIRMCEQLLQAAQQELSTFASTQFVPRWDMEKRQLSQQAFLLVGRKDRVLESYAQALNDAIVTVGQQCQDTLKSINQAKSEMSRGQDAVKGGFGSNAANGNLNPSPSPSASPNDEAARRAEERAEQAERENARMQQALRDEEMRRQQAQQQAAKAQEEAGKKKDDGGDEDKQDNKPPQQTQPSPAPAAPQPSPSPAPKPSANYPEICPDGSRNPAYPSGNGCKEKKVTDPLQSAAIGAQGASASKGITNLTAKDCVGVNTASCQAINANAAAGRALVNEAAPSKTRQLVGEEIKKNPLLKNGKK